MTLPGCTVTSLYQSSTLHCRYRHLWCLPELKYQFDVLTSRRSLPFAAINISLPTRNFSLLSAMWSSGEDNGTNRCTSSFSSKSSSTYSSSSNFSPSSSLTAPSKKRTMEEVWKDIGLRSLQNPPHREEAGSKGSYRRTILQEFLARPFGDQQHSKNALLDPSPDMGIHAFACEPPPATALSLNSRPEFQYLDSPGLKNSNPFKNLYDGDTNACFCATSLASPFDVLQSSLPKRRMTEPAEKCVDRRHKRMIKNRESAARSRARKQAYTDELELEVANLMEENVKLKKQQQEQQGLLAGLGNLSKRRSLCRTSTAPF